MAAEHPWCSTGRCGIPQNSFHRSFGPKSGLNSPLLRNPGILPIKMKIAVVMMRKENRSLFPNSAEKVAQPRLSPSVPQCHPCHAEPSPAGGDSAPLERAGMGPFGNIPLNYCLFLFGVMNTGAGSCRCLVGSAHRTCPKRLLAKSWIFYPG